MNRIGELNVMQNQFDPQVQNMKSEIKNLERVSEEKDKEVKSANDKCSKLKLEVNSLLIDKKLLTENIDYLNESLKEKDEEIAKIKDEYYEVQENFITAIEEFLQKLDDQKNKNSKRYF